MVMITILLLMEGIMPTDDMVMEEGPLVDAANPLVSPHSWLVCGAQPSMVV